MLLDSANNSYFITDIFNSVTGSVLQAGTWNISNITGTMPGFSGSSFSMGVTGSIASGSFNYIGVVLFGASGSTYVPIRTGISGSILTHAT